MAIDRGNGEAIIPREQQSCSKRCWRTRLGPTAGVGIPQATCSRGSWSVVYAVTGWSSTTVAARRQTCPLVQVQASPGLRWLWSGEPQSPRRLSI
jgi:hypothetical protein